MKPRTEDDILARTPIMVRLGDQDYEIALLSVFPQREWRKKLFASLAPILASFNFRVDGASMTHGLTAALLEFPETLADLVFAYGTSLPKEEILGNATEEQMAAAFSAIMAVAFPFLPQLATMTQVLKSASLPQPASSTN